MTCTTNLQHSNLQYLLTKKIKTKPTTTKIPNKTMLSPPGINIEGTGVGREEGLTFLP